MPLVVKDGSIVVIPGDESLLLATDVACCCEGGGLICTCQSPINWRITDQDGNVYSFGPVVSEIWPPAVFDQYCGQVRPVLKDFPSEWTPRFYWSTGELSMKLEVEGCGGGWHTLEEWIATISLCDQRYPPHTFAESWPPPADCECANQAAVDADAEECQPCPEMVPQQGLGLGDPPPGVGVVFTGDVDGEWTNLLNWQDENGVSPAGSLPTDVAEINADVTSDSSPNGILLVELIINAGAKFCVPAVVGTLHCYGSVESAEFPVCEGQLAAIDYSEDAFFYGDGYLAGEVEGLTATNPVTFYDNAYNIGQVTGQARFEGEAENGGIVTGGPDVLVRAEFYGTATNQGTIAGNAIFYNSAENQGTVDGNGEFNDDSRNEGAVAGDGEFNNSSRNDGTVQGQATFNGSSKNLLFGVVVGNATFNGTAENDFGVVEGNAEFNSGSKNKQGNVEGNAVFNEESENAAASAVFLDATFNGSSLNSGDVVGSAIFNGSAVNAATGSVFVNAVFGVEAINRGSVTGTATFNDDACNDGGTAGTFVPDPPPSC